MKMIEVREKQEETNALIEKVEESKYYANIEQEQANKEEEEASVLSEAANKLKSEAEKELAAAEPAMFRAKEAVDCLTKPSIVELKSLKEPVVNVLDVTKAVLLMRGEKRNFAWNNGQKMMNNPAKFIDDLKGYNKEEIDEWILDQLQPLLSKDYFNKEDMKRYSSAASNLCDWVVNVVEYNRIYKKVKPLMERKAGAEEECAKKEEELKVVRAKVKEVNDKVAALEAELAEANTVKEKVESEAEHFSTMLQLAQRLVNGLADENTRWGDNVRQFRLEERTIVGDSLVAAAFVSYIAPFSASIRLQLWQDTWIPNVKDREIPFTEGVDPLRVLCTDSDEARWKNFGLPADRMSIENASIVTSASRWPLLIDP